MADDETVNELVQPVADEKAMLVDEVSAAVVAKLQAIADSQAEAMEAAAALAEEARLAEVDRLAEEQAMLDAAAEAAELKRKADQEAYWKSPEFIKQRQIDAEFYKGELAKSLIAQSQGEAARQINIIAPVYKQINLLRENPTDAIFAKIDVIRKKADAIEKTIRSKTHEELVVYSLESAWA